MNFGHEKDCSSSTSNLPSRSTFRSAYRHPLSSFPFRVTGPFGYNDKVNIRVVFSLPVTIPPDGEIPSLVLVVGSKSTARTVTYLTASAVYTADMSGNASVQNDSSVLFQYVVGADDVSVDLRCARSSSSSRLIQLLCLLH